MPNKINVFPLVTIAIPTYNNERYIADAITSAMAQDYPNLEILIADDASEDNTEQIVRSFCTDPRVHYFKNKKNIGRVANYHKALYQLATGEWYLNLDGDDYLTDPSFISKAVSWTRDYDNVVMVTGACERVVNGKLHYVIRSNYNAELCCIDGKTFFLDLPAEKANFIHLATLYNRAKAKSLNFYSENILSTDFESLFRLALTGNIVCYDKIVGLWRIHGENESVKGVFSAGDIISNFKFIENSALFAASYLPKKSIERWRKIYFIKIIESYIVSIIINRPKNSFNITLRLFKTYPAFYLKAWLNIFVRKAKKIFFSSKASTLNINMQDTKIC
ncbi:MAG: glycosyltransferase family 2 protein [Ferruginibacter sp.]